LETLRVCIRHFPSVVSAALHVLDVIGRLAVPLFAGVFRLLATVAFIALQIGMYVAPFLLPVLSDWKVIGCLASMLLFPWAWGLMFLGVFLTTRMSVYMIKKLLPVLSILAWIAFYVITLAWLLVAFSMLICMCILINAARLAVRLCLYLIVGTCLTVTDGLCFAMRICLYFIVGAFLTLFDVVCFSMRVSLYFLVGAYLTLIDVMLFFMRVSLYFVVGAYLTLIDVLKFVVHIAAFIVVLSMVVLGCAVTYFVDALCALGCEALRMRVAVSKMVKKVKDEEAVVGPTGAGEEEMEAADIAADGEGAAGVVVEEDEEEKTRSRTASILSFWGGIKKRLSISA
jgi:hypothetical protein